MSHWRSSSSANGGRKNGRRWSQKTRGHALAAGQGRLTVFRSKYFFFFFFFFFDFANDFLREGRRVCKACATAKQRCGGTPSRCPGRRRRMWRKGAVAGRSRRGRRRMRSRLSSDWWWRSCGDEWQGAGRGRSGGDKTGICIGMDMLKFRLLFSHYK